MRDTFNEIWSTLRQNKLRTALTGFAVAWGIFLLIALLGAGNGVLNALMNNSGQMTNSMIVYPGYTSKEYAGFEKWRRLEMDIKDVENLKAGPYGDRVDEVSPLVSHSDSLIFGERYFSCSLYGITKTFSEIQNLQLYAGRFINDPDIKEMRRVVVMGSREVELLLGDGSQPADMVGKYVKIGPFSYKVVGVYKTGENSGGRSAEVLAPYSTVSTIYNKGKDIETVYFSFHDIDTQEESDKFEDAYRSMFNNRHLADPEDENTVYFWNMMVSNEQMNKAIGYIRTALWILGMFSLLSGIVGVSNIMLITVKERTHEFGIRKAIGAKPWSILKLIITESVTITAFFGYIGMILGMVACEVMNTMLGDSPTDMGIAQITMFVNPGVGVDVAIKATVLLVVAGTVAGMIPAWKASKVKPIEALRAE